MKVLSLKELSRAIKLFGVFSFIIGASRGRNLFGVFLLTYKTLMFTLRLSTLVIHALMESHDLLFEEGNFL